MLLPELWIQIFSYFNKKELSEFKSVVKFFLNVINEYKLIENAAWPLLDYRRVTPIDIGITELLCYKMYTFPNGTLVIANHLTKENLYLWERGAISPKQFVQDGPVGDVVFLDKNYFASCDHQNIKIWNVKFNSFSSLALPKTAAANTPIKSKPKFLFHFEDKKQIACLYYNGQVHLWHTSGEYIKLLLTAESALLPVRIAILQANHLVFVHAENTLCGSDKAVTIHNINDGSIIKTIHLSEHKNKLMNLIPTNINHLNTDNRLKVNHITTDYFILEINNYYFLFNIDETKEPILLGKTSECKYSFSHKGDLIILNEEKTGYQLLARYQSNENKFSIKLLLPNQHPSLEKRQSTIMPDGSIITIYGDYHFASKWDFTEQAFEPNFQLEKPRKEDETEISITCLPQGDILSWYKLSGSFVIHDGKTGKIKLNQYFYMDNNINDTAQYEIPIQLENGDFVVRCIKYDRHEEMGLYHSRFFRFGLFEDTQKNAEETETCEPPKKRQKR